MKLIFIGARKERRWDCFYVVCASASGFLRNAFRSSAQRRVSARKDSRIAGQFGAQLTGVPEETFVSIVGKLATRAPATDGSESEVSALCQVDLGKFYLGIAAEQAQAIEPFLKYRNEPPSEDIGQALFGALEAFAPFNQLVNETMKAAIPLSELGTRVFPGIEPTRADAAVNRLLALGSRARRAADEPSLLPCRIHSFFRGCRASGFAWTRTARNWEKTSAADRAESCMHSRTSDAVAARRSSNISRAGIAAYILRAGVHERHFRSSRLPGQIQARGCKPMRVFSRPITARHTARSALPLRKGAEPQITISGLDC